VRRWIEICLPEGSRPAAFKDLFTGGLAPYRFYGKPNGSGRLFGLLAERRKPSGEALDRDSFTGGLAPYRFYC
jgi:hypothetical protein